VSTRSAGSRGAALLALALALTACSGQGPGADSCRTIEHARCDRQAACEDWSKGTREDCRVERDAACHAGAVPAVRDAARTEVDACAQAIRGAECEAPGEPFALPGCEALAPDEPDAG
jgi:hypothetical protein